MNQRLQLNNSQTTEQQAINQTDGVLNQTPPAIGHSRHHCAACGFETAKQADVCEQCGHWQLPGQCCFCYTLVETGYAFCPECGNPPTGKECPTCHTHSLFDFCSNCQTVLTQQALQTIDLIQSSEAIQVLRGIVTGMASSSSNSQGASYQLSMDTDIQALQSFLAGWSATKQDEVKVHTVVPKPASFNLQIEVNTADRLKQMSELDQQAARITQEQQMLSKQQEQFQQQLAALQQKTFTNNQEARRYYGALKAVIPKVYEMALVEVPPPKPRGWRCKAFGVVHSTGPSSCSRPGDGGEWLYE